MNKNFTILLLLVSITVFGQTGMMKNYQLAYSLMQKDSFAAAYRIYKTIEPLCDTKDTLYRYILWYYTSSVTQLEKNFREHQQFDSSLFYGLEALKLIEKGKPIFDKKFEVREFWMTKNIVVSYFGLEQYENAEKYKAILYKAYKEKKLPEGIDEYFNFSFFKWGDKNVWGYEWFEELPENRLNTSFTKIVYYIYSTNPDGTDKDQLFRLHVLMFHKINNSIKFDYVLTKIYGTPKREHSETLYDYTYTKDINYKKLQADIKDVLNKSSVPANQPDIK
jgi:hypothetical protein